MRKLTHKQAPTRSLQMDGALVDALADMAEHKREEASVNGKRGPRVTIRGLVEEAVLSKWPELRSRAPVVSDPAAAGASEDESAEARGQMFAEILKAVFSHATPDAQQAAIEALEGSVYGTFGQRLRLKELAYHLRSSEAPIGSMDDLVRSFEAM